MENMTVFIFIKIVIHDSKNDILRQSSITLKLGMMSQVHCTCTIPLTDYANTDIRSFVDFIKQISKLPTEIQFIFVEIN